MPTVYLGNQASIQDRLLFEIGFNTRHYGMQVFMLQFVWCGEPISEIIS